MHELKVSNGRWWGWCDAAVAVERKSIGVTPAEVIGIESGAVVFGGPQPACGLVGKGDDGLVVADPFAQRQRPGAGAIERLLSLLRDLGAARDRASAVDQQHAQVDVAAFATGVRRQWIVR